MWLTTQQIPLSRNAAGVRAVAGVVALFFSSISPAIAEPPAVTSLYPAGVQRGQTVDVTLNGKPGTAPVEAWTESDALTLTMSEDGKTMTVAAADAATAGLHWIRFHNAEDAGELRPFFVGVLPELSETEPNDALDAAIATELPAVVNGILNKSGDVDTFAVALEAGQTLIASIESNRSLASPLDGIVQVLSPAGFVLEQNDDDHGVDPQLVFTAAESGLYFVRVFGFPAAPNSTVRFAGGAEYIYRLSLTTGPFVDHVGPAAQETPDEFRAVGWNLPDQLTMNEVAETPGLHRVRPFDPSGPIAVGESDVETGSIPLRVIGRLDAPGEVDSYEIAAAEGQSLTIAVQARALDRPLDAVLRVLNEAGEQLQETDDPSRNVFDPSLTWKAPADGTYTVEIRDRFGHGGARYVYDLSVIPVEPRVALQVAADHFKVKPGESLEIETTVDRQGGYNTELKITAEGLPEGVTCEAATSPGEGDAAKSVKLKLNAGADVAFSGPLRIVGSADETPAAIATAALKLSGARTESVWLTVGP